MIPASLFEPFMRREITIQFFHRFAINVFLIILPDWFPVISCPAVVWYSVMYTLHSVRFVLVIPSTTLRSIHSWVCVPRIMVIVRSFLRIWIKAQPHVLRVVMS